MVTTNELKREINNLQDDRYIFLRINGEDYVMDTINRDADSLEKSADWYYILNARKAEGVGLKR